MSAEIKMRADFVFDAKNHICPLCSNPVTSKERFTVPNGFRIYGRSIKELLNIIHYAQQHGYTEASHG